MQGTLVTTPANSRFKQWFVNEKAKISADKVYKWSAFFLVVNLIASVSIGVYAAVCDKDKLFIAVAAGFVVITEGIIDYSSELSPVSKKGLQIFKLAYRCLGVIITVCAVAF